LSAVATAVTPFASFLAETALPAWVWPVIVTAAPLITAFLAGEPITILGFDWSRM
jgi:hypothetical protein